MSNVWIGLIKSNEEGGFSWTDYKPLTGEGYWGAAPSDGRAPLCAALDPARDYRWDALSCGGPQVASFICELPVPTWAVSETGGCLVRSLPSLTVQFLPELAAVQLVSDCGLDGTKQVTCKPNEDHKDILKELSCIISDEDFSDNTVSSAPAEIVAIGVSSGSTRAASGSWPWSASTPAGDFTSTRLRRETLPTSTPLPSTAITGTLGYSVTKPETKLNQPNKDQVPLETATAMKNLTPPDKPSDINPVSENPKKAAATSTSVPVEEATARKVLGQSIHALQKEGILVNKPKNNGFDEHKAKEKEQHIDIFTQATDHFIPPLVMAKSKMGTDMTVVSPETKHNHHILVHHSLNSLKHHDHDFVTIHPVHDDKLNVPPSKISEPIAVSTPSVLKTVHANKETVGVALASSPKLLKMSTDIEKLIATTVSPGDKQTPEPPKVTLTTSLPIIEKDAKDADDSSVKDLKYRKPSKGKKYDRMKEDKKKYGKELSTESPVVTVQTAHKIVEVTIPNMSGSQAPVTVIEITTKLLTPSSTQKEVSTPSTLHEILTTSAPVPSSMNIKNAPQVLIDPNIMKLNKVGIFNNESEQVKSSKASNQSEVTTTYESLLQNDNTKKIIKIDKIDSFTKSLPAKLVTSSKIIDETTTDHTPDPLPRPNRSRILTHPPQHRAFYPYFFNRVLG